MAIKLGEMYVKRRKGTDNFNIILSIFTGDFVDIA